MTRPLAGLLLLVAFAGYASVKLFVSEYREFRAQPAPGHSAVDSITAYVSRFERLKALVPPDAVVQFVNRDGEDRRAFLYHYALTQYALAPILIDSLPRHKRVVVNFPDANPARIGRFAEAESLTVLTDFDNGVVLFQKRNQR